MIECQSDKVNHPSHYTGGRMSREEFGKLLNDLDGERKDEANES